MAKQNWLSRCIHKTQHLHQQMQWVHQPLRFFKTLYFRFIDDGCMYRAAALTYTTLLSLVPLMTVGFAVISAFPLFNKISQQIQDFIFKHFVAASGEVVKSYLQHFVAQTANLSVIGMIFLLITAVLMMFNIEQALNKIWHVRQRRNGIAAFMLYWAVLTLSPILLGAGMVVSSYLANLRVVTETAETLGLKAPFLLVLPFLLSTITFALIYIAVPNCRVPFKQGIIGAVVAAILFELAKHGFTYYVQAFPTYTLLYGTLATIPVFLVWLYLMWLIILFGAVLSNVLTIGYAYRSTKKMDGFTHAFRWLGHLWQAMDRGKPLTLQDLVARDSGNYRVDPEVQLNEFLKAKLIQTAGNGEYLLSRDLSALTLKDLLNLLPWRLPTSDELKLWSEPWEQQLALAVRSIEQGDSSLLNTSIASFYQTAKTSTSDQLNDV